MKSSEYSKAKISRTNTFECHPKDALCFVYSHKKMFWMSYLN